MLRKGDSSALNLDAKIAHLQMLQGVIARMASEVQTVKMLAVTVAIGVATLADKTGPNARLIVWASLVPIFIFWVLAAHSLVVERAYRALYDKVRQDDPVQPFAMNWRDYREPNVGILCVMFSPSVLFPFLASVVPLVILAFALS